jgi:hypothetical protein
MAGSYDARLVQASRDAVCVPCMLGSSCGNEWNVSVLVLPLQRGYYRRSSLSIDVRVCPDADMNCSNADRCTFTSSGCRGGNDSTAACMPSLEGPFCKLCEQAASNETDSEQMYYVKATESAPAHCAPCRDTLAMTMGVGAAIVAGVVLLAVLWNMIACFFPRCVHRAAGLWSHFNLLNKSKIMISFYQVPSMPL